jgi:foldase protein PrsA
MRTAVACFAAIATAVGVGACGGTSVPSGDIAVVGNAKVTNAQFVHWLTVANNSAYVNTGDTPPAAPLPPNFTACIASERLRNATGTATSALKKICASDYTSELEPAVVGILVEGIWFQGEAVDRHIHITTAAIDKAWNTEREQEFPTTAKLDTFLAESGYTVKDLEWVELLNLLQTAIVNKVEAGAKKVSNAQIAAYYKAHVAEFTQPERRDIELVLVSSAATAAKVKSLLAGGASFASVAKQYSIDPTTKNNGGVEDGVEQGEETAAFNDAIFASPVGMLEGPVKTAFGYYVFKVTKSLAKSVQSLTAESSAIKSQIAETRENNAIDSLRTSFAKKWRARTTCGSDYLVSTVCGNAPAAASTGSSGTTGST